MTDEEKKKEQRQKDRSYWNGDNYTIGGEEEPDLAARFAFLMSMQQ